MPIYEYRCVNSHQYECWESFQAPVDQLCPTCGAAAKRILSAPTIIFKGSGFYSTDNRRSTSASSGPASSDSSISDAASSDSSSSVPSAPAGTPASAGD